MRTAVIGLGSPGLLHTKNVLASGKAEIVAYADIDISKAQKTAGERGGNAYADYREMLDRENLDAVFLCTPHFVRLDPIREIAARGVALFCEKPPAFTLEEARECAQVIAGAGIINAVGFMYRWARISEEMRNRIAGRKLLACLIRGAWPVLFWKGIPPWLSIKEKSGGAIVEQGVHLIDVARYMTQDEMTGVHAFGAHVVATLSPECTVEDTVSVNYRFASGALGAHLHNWSHQGWVWEVDCIGEDFRLTWDMANNRLVGKVGEEPVEIREQDDCYRTEVEGFLEAVSAGDQSRIRSSYADSVRTLAVALAAAQSLETGEPLAVEQP
jgi:predicted dehydrogenase